MSYHNTSATNGRYFDARRRSFQEIKSQYRGQWQDILTAAGIDPASLTNRHGPCPACGGKDRFRFDDKNGDGTFICTHCGSGDGLKLIQNVRGIDFVETVNLVNELTGSPRLKLATCSHRPQQAEFNDQEKYQRALAKMQNVWAEATPVQPNDPAWLYLTRTRQLQLAAIPDALRYHPKLTLKLEDGRFHPGPAMVAALTDPDGALVQVHRTFITPDGEKALGDKSKRLMWSGDTPMPPGAAIKLFEPGTTLGVTEGIENALACHQASGIPTWACYSSNIMHKLIVPASVELVIIFGDNDMEKAGKCAGQEAAETLAEKLYKEGKRVKVILPPTVGRDWTDEITQEVR